MNYELAKKLKDTGFPQKQGRMLIDPRKPIIHNNEIIGTESVEMWANRNAIAPTLFELIEACGYGFRSLSFHSDGRWLVKGGKAAFGKWKLFNGKTAEEAVANLWLALNKK